MSDLKDYFLQNARLSRRSLARYLSLNRADIDDVAEDLELGERVTFEEAQELMLELDESTVDGEEGDEDEDEDDSASDEEE